MPAKDIFHDIVKTALEKAGWKITHDPYSVRFGEIDFFVDLAAEKIIAAEKGDEKIAVEIKSFPSPSPVSDFHTALGQFMNYRMIMKHHEPERILYLAVPLDTYESFFMLPFGLEAIRHHTLKLIVYSVQNKEITTWIK
ncbi:element excision factor XisH family protein [Desulfobacterales bacterium HSG17]|nr:element excision factor XisH family protein [Desulfobacterales bacterium HSG17]